YIDGKIAPDWVVKMTPTGWTDHDTDREWLQHLDQHMRAYQKGQYRMLVLDGHGSHINAEFNEYCKENNLVPLCPLAH
ncbi:hypothetical protein C7212DRAFT_53790, partial [Tuber magnatum]